jgi:hypothetical protein
MIVALYRQFNQGIAVAGCALMSFSTLGYMINDSHQIEKKQIRLMYENKIVDLNNKISELVIDRNNEKTK